MLSASLVFSDNRIAFIVGNEAYEKNPLENPVKDAESLNEVLQEYGFETYLETNINQKKFVEIYKRYQKKFPDGGEAAQGRTKSRRFVICAQSFVVPVRTRSHPIKHNN